MKKFIFLSLPGHGHTNPTLTIAKELVRQGHTVLYFSTEEFRQKIEESGVIFKKYQTEQIDGRISRNLSMFAEALVAICENELPTLLKVIEKEKPDCIVYDILAIWGRIAAHASNTPAVSLITTVAFNYTLLAHYPQMTIPLLFDSLSKGGHFIHAVKKHKMLLKQYGLENQFANNIYDVKENLNLVFTSAYFQPCANSFDNSYKFVGPSFSSRSENADFLKKLDTSKKLIYISFGTIYNDNVELYHVCIEALRKSSYQAIISIGHRHTQSDLPPIPQNIIVKNHIPQLEVLQKADLFISHAGMNSTNESLYYGVPLITIPQMHEQTLNALRIEQLGAGVVLKKEKVTEKTLLTQMERIVETKSFYTCASAIQRTLIDAGGYKKATQEIVNCVKM